MLGWVGFILLLLAYSFLVIPKLSKHFLWVDALATSFLVIHAIFIVDFPFIVVNSFIFVMLLIKIYQGGIE